MQNFKVADLVHDDGHWNLALLNHWLPVHVLRKLVAILPPSDSSGPDIRAGLANGKSYFSVSMMYRLLCNFQMDDMNTDWKQIWCLKVLE